MHDAGLADEPDLGELGRQGPVGVLIVLELAGHDTARFVVRSPIK